ncbi:MAG: hypothetical protein CVV64_01245 [Candidatus Wallbacteria bacterium HGW-Wallbacteria-1]|jgi:hypothetical protein|uniref:Tetratricopeptide repeat-like domain-containing protein n=1 Tax=Candidatus Wallbacteria bacterium HGW-Wallbacteria-1 TaxID=2013854 RepID=A0A2N1PUP6_9BACT|nr:MAG: hypothetical protein CVV64_01245 [Candidatus Wallbacteria bacterium HGW-Wallbacteria-1]
MEYVQKILIGVVVCIILFLMTPLSDDLRFMIAEMHEQMGNSRSAVESYERVIRDFTNKKQAAEAALIRLAPESIYVRHLLKKGSRAGKINP